MSSPSVAVSGCQQPRISLYPEYGSSAGQEAIDLAAVAGLYLDEWQQTALKRALGEGPDGKWAAFQVVLVAPRQNGKNAVTEARELAGLFLFGDRLIIHSAHMFDTSVEAFLRLEAMIDGTPEFSRRVKSISRAHGSEGITLMNGQRLRYRARTKGGGRGFTCDLLILDEAMDLPESTVGAIIPTLSSRPKPQIWYSASAVDQLVHDNGVALARLRERAFKGDQERLAYFEWSFDAESPELVDDVTAGDPAVWAQANPALGLRITPEYVADERNALDPRTFAVERLCVGDWPNVSGETSIIDLAHFRSLTDTKSVAVDPVCFAIDTTPLRSHTAFGVAGKRKDDLYHVEIVEHRRGTGWVIDRAVELWEKHQPVAFIIDGRSPAASFVHALEERGVKVVVMNSTDQAKASGGFYDAIEQSQIRHLGTQELETAIRGAGQRTLGDAWAWSRTNSTTDISPLVAVTDALWGIATQEGPSVYESRGLLVMG